MRVKGNLEQREFSRPVHESDALGPKILSKIARHTGLTPEAIICEISRDGLA